MPPLPKASLFLIWNQTVLLRVIWNMRKRNYYQFCFVIWWDWFIDYSHFIYTVMKLECCLKQKMALKCKWGSKKGPLPSSLSISFSECESLKILNLRRYFLFPKNQARFLNKRSNNLRSNIEFLEPRHHLWAILAPSFLFRQIADTTSFISYL